MRLRTRFALWTGLLISGVLFLFGAVTYFSTSRGLRSALDDSLLLNASQALATIDIENNQMDFIDSLPDAGPLGELADRGLTLRILDPLGGVLQAFGAYQYLPVTNQSLKATHEQRSVFETLTAMPDEEPVRVYSTPYLYKGELIGIIQVAQSLETVQETLQRLLITLLASAPLLALMTALGSYYLAGRALSPIDDISSTAQRISAEDLSARLNLADTRDEVSRLANAFDKMLARLEEAFRRERQFTSDASHELRTPLAAMQAILSVMGEGKRTPEEYQAALADLNDEMRRLQQISDNLLLLARGDSHLVERGERVDIALLLGDLAEAMRPQAEKKQLTLECHAPGKMVTLGSYDDLIRMFANLLDNAIKFTQRGEIIVSGRNTDQRITVEIQDSGPGIPAEHLAHIFDRFYRGEFSRSTPGFGLGLSIANEIARGHGGSIEVESTVGKGTVFRVTLPAVTQS